MADEDISLTEDQLLDNLNDTDNGDAEFLNEVISPAFSISSYSRAIFPSTFDGNCPDFAIAFFSLRFCEMHISQRNQNGHHQYKSTYGLRDFFFIDAANCFCNRRLTSSPSTGSCSFAESHFIKNCFVSIRRNLHLKGNSKNICKAKLRM